MNTMQTAAMNEIVERARMIQDQSGGWRELAACVTEAVETSETARIMMGLLPADIQVRLMAN